MTELYLAQGTCLTVDGVPVMFGTPFYVACDQGGDFISGQMRDGCFRLGMHLLPLPPGAPKMKPKVERFIRTLKYGQRGSNSTRSPTGCSRRGRRERDRSS